MAEHPFSVPFNHRVTFTRGLFAPLTQPEHQPSPLAGVLVPPAPHAPARVMSVFDGGLLRAQPDLHDRVVSTLETLPGVEQAAPGLVLPGGEDCKNDPTLVTDLLDRMDAARLCRRSYVLAIGGGALLDVAGFAAATLHRGVRLIRVGTTTLAQADSAVGVKNGVNARGKKNLLGTFAVPWAVLNDLDLLGSLDDRDWRGGFSEAVKVALVKDRTFFERLEHDAERVNARDPQASEHAIRRSAELHLEHITAGGDPFELTEARPLDFGHWAAHKLEQMTGYSLRHGEAVAIGVALDARLSALTGMLDHADADRVDACLRRLGFDLWHDAMHRCDELLTGLEEFREHLGGRLTIAMLAGLGQQQDVHEIEPARVREAIDTLHSRESDAT